MIIKLYNKFKESFDKKKRIKEIHEECKELGFERYTINDDLSVDIENHYANNDKFSGNFKGFPFKIRNLGLNTIKITNSKLESLVNFPDNWRGNLFLFANNNLKSLEGCPNGLRYLLVTNCGLETLKGCPEKLEEFDCTGNKLTSMEFGPKECYRYCCSLNKIKSFEWMPKEVGILVCVNCGIKTTEGIPKATTYMMSGNNFPPEIEKNIHDDNFIKGLIEWQDEYNIWNGDNLNKFRFEEMMRDIKDFG